MRKQLTIWAVALAALSSLWVVAVQTQTIQCGGSFVPSLNCVISGRWNYTSADAVSGLPTPFQNAGVTATGVVSRTVTLGHGQIILLGTTPITGVPAPGPGKWIDVIGAQLFFDYTTAYAGGANLRLWYGTTRAIPASEAITVSGFLVSVTADHTVRVQGTPSNTPDIPLNTAVMIGNINGVQFTSGNAANTLRVTIHYRVVTASGTVN